MVDSSCSKSCRTMSQPSTTRNTSPKPSPGICPGGAHPPVGGHASRCRARRSTAPARSSRVATSATVRRTRSPSRRVATPPTCGRPVQRRERAATEVEAVELDLLRGVHQGQRRDQRPQHGRLAALRAADHADVARGAGQVQPERVAPLVERPVDDADRRVQLPAALPARRGVARGRAWPDSGGSRSVQRRRLLQRRQPDLVRRRAAARRAGVTTMSKRLSWCSCPPRPPSSCSGSSMICGADVVGPERHDLPDDASARCSSGPLSSRLVRTRRRSRP